MKIILGKINNDYYVAKEDAALLNNLLIALLKKNKLSDAEKHIELSKQLPNNLIKLSLSKEALEMLSTFPASVLQREFNLSNQADIHRIVIFLTQQKIVAANQETTISPQKLIENPKQNEDSEKMTFIEKADLEAQIMTLIDTNQKEIVEALGLSQETYIITNQQILSANAHLEGHDSVLFPGTLCVSFRTKNEAEKFIEIFKDRKVISFTTEYTIDKQKQRLDCFGIAMEYRELFYFPNKNKEKAKKLAELIKKYDSIQTPDFFKALDILADTKSLGIKELLKGINYYYTISIRELWLSHRFMESILEACRQCQISEFDLLIGLIGLHQKRKELFDVSEFLQMIFSLSVQKDHLIKVCHHLMENNLLDEASIHKIKLDLIPHEYRLLFFEIFKEYYKDHSIEFFIDLMELFTTDKDQAKFIEALCTSKDYLNEEQVIVFLRKNVSFRLNRFPEKALSILKVAPTALKNDYYFVNSILDINEHAFQYASPKLRNSERFILNFAWERNHPKDYIYKPHHIFKYADESLKKDKKFVLSLLEHSGNSLEYVSEELKDDEEVVRKAVNHRKECFKYASERIKNNEQFVLELCDSRGSVLGYASEKFRSDKAFVLKIFKNSCPTLSEVAENLRDDLDIVCKALKYKKENLKFVSNRLLKDRSFILDFLSKWEGWSAQTVVDVAEGLRYFKDDQEVILIIARKILKTNHPEHFHLFPSQNLLNDKKFALTLLNLNGGILGMFPEDVKHDQGIVMEVLKNDFWMFKHISENLRMNKTFVLNFLAQRERNLSSIYSWEFFSALKHFNEDLEVILAVAQKIEKDDKMEWTEYLISENIRKDKASVLKLLKLNATYFEIISDDLKTDPDVILATVTNNLAYSTYAQHLWHDELFVFKFLQTNKDALKFVPEGFQANKKIVLKAIESYPKALKYASNELKKDRELVIYALFQLRILQSPLNLKSSLLSFFSASKSTIALEGLYDEFDKFLKKEEAQKFLESAFDISSEVFEELKKVSSPGCILQ